MILLLDNKSIIDLTRNLMLQERSKHNELEFNIFREEINKKVSKVVHSLVKNYFKMLKKKILVVLPDNLTFFFSSYEDES